MAETETFPLDWNAWHEMWVDWWKDHQSDLRPSSYRFPAKNIMADAILGNWSVNDRNVELSEVTFLNLRGIGITFGTAAGTDVPENGVVHSFEELERELGIS